MKARQFTRRNAPVYRLARLKMKPGNHVKPHAWERKILEAMHTSKQGDKP